MSLHTTVLNKIDCPCHGHILKKAKLFNSNNALKPISKLTVCPFCSKYSTSLLVFL